MDTQVRASYHSHIDSRMDRRTHKYKDNISSYRQQDGSQDTQVGIIYHRHIDSRLDRQDAQARAIYQRHIDTRITRAQ